MIFGKYGKMILANMERNYPYRKQELELTGELKIKIFEREKYILELKNIKVNTKITKKGKIIFTNLVKKYYTEFSCFSILLNISFSL